MKIKIKKFSTDKSFAQMAFFSYLSLNGLDAQFVDKEGIVYVLSAILPLRNKNLQMRMIGKYEYAMFDYSNLYPILLEIDDILNKKSILNTIAACFENVTRIRILKESNMYYSFFDMTDYDQEDKETEEEYFRDQNPLFHLTCISESNTYTITVANEEKWNKVYIDILINTLNKHFNCFRYHYAVPK